MDCCQRHQHGLNSVFDARNARAETRDYFKHGLDKLARKVVRALLAGGDRGLQGASVLEVGGGIGGLHVELLKHGAARATSVDLSQAYVTAAQTLAERAGVRAQVEYRYADFAREADTIPPADVVVLHRVVCCYPEMPPLVQAAAKHAQRTLSLTFPRGEWYVRWGVRVMNFGLWLMRSGFRVYAHPPAHIVAEAARAGLRPVRQVFAGVWQIVVFER